jgi:hypothetical protein
MAELIRIIKTTAICAQQIQRPIIMMPCRPMIQMTTIQPRGFRSP